MIENVSVYGGNGEDEIDFDNFYGPVQVAGTTTIHTGGNIDEVNLDRAQLNGLVSIKTHAGNDDVNIGECQLGNHLSIYLGSGDDFLNIYFTNSNSSFLYGISDFDTGWLTSSLLGNGRRRTVLSFESGNLAN